MGRFAELLVSIKTFPADFVAPFFDKSAEKSSTRAVFYYLCCCVYYMNIAKYMKALDLSSYICEFTLLAVRCLSVDESQIENGSPLYLERYQLLQGDGGGDGMEESGRAGLFVTLFENYTKLRDYPHALHAVVQMAEEANGESDETAKNCLRSLLVQLCDNKRLSVLCNRACVSGEENEAFWGSSNQVC